MALQPTTELESHPVGTTGLNGIINGNWQRLEAIFQPLAATDLGKEEIEWDQGTHRFALRAKAQPLTDAANIVWNLAAGTRMAEVTLAGNRTLNNPTNGRPGTFVLRVKQDGTGSRTLTLSGNYRMPVGAPLVLSTAANAVDILTFHNFGDGIYYGTAAYNMTP